MSGEAGLDLAARRAPLVMRFGAFGDMVLLTVLLTQLRARFGQQVDVVGSGPWTRPLLEGQPAVGRLFVIRSRRTPYWISREQQSLVRWLKERGPGPTWFCDIHLGKDLLRRGGIPDEFICEYQSTQWSPDVGFADRFVQLGNQTPAAFGGLIPGPLPPVTRRAQLVISASDRVSADQWLAERQLAGKPFVVVHPGSAHIARRSFRSPVGTDRYWPEDRWAGVVNAVLGHCPGHLVVFTGTRAERKFVAAIIGRTGATRVYNAADELDVRTLVAVLERAHSMISIDTGPAHAAAALGVPTVGIFGSQNPVLFRPGGATTPAVAITGTVNGAQSILGITVEAVVDAWLDLLSQSKSAQGILLTP